MKIYMWNDIHKRRCEYAKKKKNDVDFIGFMDIADEFKSLHGYQEVKTI